MRIARKLLGKALLCVGLAIFTAEVLAALFGYFAAFAASIAAVGFLILQEGDQ